MTQKQILLWKQKKLRKRAWNPQVLEDVAFLKNNRNGQSRLNWKKSSRVMLDQVKRP